MSDDLSDEYMPTDVKAQESASKNNNISYAPNLQDIDIRGSILLKPNDQGITIKVCDPVIKEETLKKYVIYTVKGEDREGSFTTVRRYSEFLLIRNWMVIRWPGCVIPPIPPKKVVGNLDQNFIEERRRFLERFVNQVAALPYLYYSEEFQVFLRSTGNLEKTHAYLGKPKYDEIIERLTTNFGHLSGKEINNEIISKIVNFNSFLVKVKQFFKGYKKMAKGFAVAKKQFYDQFNIFNNYFLNDYEKRVFMEYTNNDESKNVVFSENSSKMNESVLNIKEASSRRSVENIYEWIRQESREVEAMIEALSQRDHYHQLKVKTEEKQKNENSELQNVVAGKTTIRTLFFKITKKSKEDSIHSIENAISKCTSDIEHLSMIHDLITIILAYHEIDKFKREKIERYYEILKTTSANELMNLKEVVSYWQLIDQNPNIRQVGQHN